MTEEKVETKPVEGEVKAEGAEGAEEAVFSISRTTATLTIKIVLAVVIGFVIAFLAPVVVAWLATFPLEVWYALGVAVAVLWTVAICARNK